MASPAQFTLELRPSARQDLIDVTQRLADDVRQALAEYRRTLYCSYHTTAGYLEQSLCARLHHSRDRLGSFVDVFGQLFPPNADYAHDELEKRRELSESQRRTEPKNADSHLAFISSGLRNCVTYVNRGATPVYFIDLDGVHEHGVRTRQTTVLGFNRERVVESASFSVPVSSHPIDSINLRDARVGLFERLDDMVRRHGVAKGRVDIALDASESSLGLTVNEYETLLMRNDLAEVLRNPFRFAARHGRSLLRNPRAIPDKTRNYAQYDFVQVVNELMDKAGVSESIFERILAKFMALPAERFLRMKRAVSLLVSDADSGDGSIVQGTYQSPILVQWRKAEQGARKLDIRLVEFS